ncbi:GrpB family protein [Bacillus mycoides]|uniref:GrpB family protein n=1 Tax=Bacillus mycoides TaxID=1405 RepID=UPI0010BF214F|nr:GrpB family protein [Bacillus mycoides]TKI26277.1 GrpB family protein [Bacillus mycoides]
MELGLKGDEVKIVPYTTEWHTEFLKVKKAIHQNTNINENHIEHIGSTAIKNMLAKPIIDILVAVDDLTTLDPSVVKGLKAIGFLRLKVERPGEIVFAKFTDDTYEEKTHYTHLVEYEKELWKNLIFFRDYLNINENARKDYIQLKLDYLKMHSTGINEYTKHKENFVKNIFKKRTND